MTYNSGRAGGAWEGQVVSKSAGDVLPDKRAGGGDKHIAGKGKLGGARSATHAEARKGNGESPNWRLTVGYLERRNMGISDA